ncbi:MAG: hypothetical protein E5X77_45075, partial [Mesorhizobium sp.]
GWINHPGLPYLRFRGYLWDASHASAAHQSFQHREIPPMMRQYELVERVQRYKPDVNEALLNKAYVY